jgi:hypothetical protein
LYELRRLEPKTACRKDLQGSLHRECTKNDRRKNDESLPGAVSVLAIVNDEQDRVKLVLDRKLASASAINCHPLSNERTTSLSQEAFAQFLAAAGREAVYIDPNEESQTQ